MVFESYQLKCYEPTLYTIVSGADNRCVAPTARSIRCPWRITQRDLQECLKFESNARNLVHGDERHDVLCSLVLLRCCEQATHREKLTYDDSGCLDEVAQAFGVRIPAKAAIKADFGEESCRVQQTLEYAQSAEDRSSVMKLEDPESPPEGSTPRYELRYRRATPFANQAGNVFIPYVTDPRDSVKGDLLCDVPLSHARTGFVYAFMWPSCPDYIKIGYTSNSSQSRVQDWQSCHPGATLCVSTAFDFPERMERLIHLQMAKQRHKIMKCKNCMKTHFEWFKLPIAVVSQIIGDWKEVITKEPFYDSTRALTKAWHSRIQNMNNEIMGAALLAVLESEDKQLEGSGQADYIRVEVSDMSKPAPEVAMESAALPEAHTLDKSLQELEKEAIITPPSPPESEGSKSSQPIVNTPERPVAIPQLPSIPFTFTHALHGSKGEKERTDPVASSGSSYTTTTFQESTPLPHLPSVPFTFTSSFEASGQGKAPTVPVFSFAKPVLFEQSMPLPSLPSNPFIFGHTFQTNKEEARTTTPLSSFQIFSSPAATEEKPIPLPSLPSGPFTFSHTLQANKEEASTVTPTLSSFRIFSSPSATPTTTAAATEDEPTPLPPLPPVPTHSPTSSKDEASFLSLSSTISPSLSTESTTLEEPLVLPSVPSHSPAQSIQSDQREKELAIPISIPAPVHSLSFLSSNDTSRKVESVPLPAEVSPDPPFAAAIVDNHSDNDTEKLEEQILTMFSDFMFMLATQSNQSSHPSTPGATAPELELTRPLADAAKPTTATAVRIAVAAS